MMLRLELTALARQKAGLTTLEVNVTDGACLREALQEIVESRLPEIRSLVLDEQHQLTSGWMLLVNGKLRDAESPHPLSDQDVLTLLAPLGGG
jgi:molybdopterin converting factor small subunit